MPKETMTPRERWTAVLRREKPDRVPMDIWSTDEAWEKLKRHVGCGSNEEVCARLHIDNPANLSPRYAGPPVAPDADMWGCRFKDVDYGTGVYRERVYSPLAQFQSVEEIQANYTWPTADWFDYSVLPEQAKGLEHRPIRAGGSEPFLQYQYMRGDEQAYLDLIVNPDMVEYAMEKMYGFCYESTRRIYEQVPGKVLISYIAEDLGGQNDLLFPPEAIRRFFLPHMRRMIALAHEAGVFAFYHTDGAARRILPDLVEAGIDVLNPIQWRCHGMERAELKRDFGAKLVFHGAVDNQQTLPFGSVEDVRREVIENLGILGAGGGYILGPCHNIQTVSPPENIVAMYETGYEEGWVG
jgi:uroporphyrinogen decarboxylase